MHIKYLLTPHARPLERVLVRVRPGSMRTQGGLHAMLLLLLLLVRSNLNAHKQTVNAASCTHKTQHTHAHNCKRSSASSVHRGDKDDDVAVIRPVLISCVSHQRETTENGGAGGWVRFFSIARRVRRVDTRWLRASALAAVLLVPVVMMMIMLGCIERRVRRGCGCVVCVCGGEHRTEFEALAAARGNISA